MVARVSLAIACAFACICRRRRRTSERLESVSARLPPVSRCTLRAMTKKRNSGASMRLAVSHSRLSRSRPIFMPPSTRRSSAPTGSAISWPAPTIASLTGRPERSARTIRSIASGNKLDEGSQAALSHASDDQVRKRHSDQQSEQQARHDADPRQRRQGRSPPERSGRRIAIAYWPTLIARPVRVRRAARRSRRGSQVRAKRSIADVALLPRQRSSGGLLGGEDPLRPVAHRSETPVEAPAGRALAQR